MRKLKETLRGIEKIDHSLADKTQNRLDNLTKPRGSLGRLEELAKQIVEITKNENPPINNKVIFTMAGDHGIAEEGLSAYPKEVTSQMVYNFLNGKAAINILADHIGARVVVVDMGVSSELKKEGFKDKKVSFGTKNMSKGPAMTREQAVRSVEAGIESFEEEFKSGIDITGTGDMGIGNTTPSSAISAVITKSAVEDVTGRGTGIDEETLRRKIEIIKKIINVNAPAAQDPLDVLSKVGGFEIGGIVGVIIASCSKRAPVVIDGFISGAAALLAYELNPDVKDYMIAAHSSVEKGHRIILDYMGLEPLLDLNMRLGEGTGAALGIGIAEAACKILTQMATFNSASVSERIVI